MSSSGAVATNASTGGPAVAGGPRDDTVAGGPGDFDVVLGGVGNDRIGGGPGAHDVASYRGAGGPIAVHLANGAVSGAEDERLSGIEDVHGGSDADTLIGSGASPNRLAGGGG